MGKKHGTVLHINLNVWFSAFSLGRKRLLPKASGLLSGVVDGKHLKGTRYKLMVYMTENLSLGGR